MVLLEKYRHLLVPWKPYLRPVEWLMARDRRKYLAQDLERVRAFFGPASPAPSGGKSALFCGFVNSPHVHKFEGLFSRMLALRGWRSACLLDLYNHDLVRPYHAAFGNPVYSLPRWIRWEDWPRLEATAREAIAGGTDAVMALEHLGTPVGLNALSTASTLSSSGAADLGDPVQADRVRSLIVRSCLYADAGARLLGDLKPDLVMAMEKGGVGASELFHQALRLGIDFVQWSACHEPESFMFKRYNRGNVRSHPFSVSPASWSAMLARPWDERYREAVLAQFEEGYGGNKWFQYKKLTDNTSMASREDIVARFSLDPSKGIAVIFSHILNDANLFYGKDLFKGGFREWLVETVRIAAGNPRVNWMLKLHPANTYRRANMGYTGEYGELLALKEALGRVPENLRIIYPDDPVNPLAWFRALDYAVTVRGTVGAEIPCFGKTVLTAGTGRYSGLGFTEDSSTASEYLARIGSIETQPRMDEERTRLALRHAYLFFRVRPASYKTFAADVFRRPAGRPFARDVEFKASRCRDLADVPELRSMIDFLAESRDEDFLGW